MTKKTPIVLVALATVGVVAALLLVPAVRTGAQPQHVPGPFDLTANHYKCYQIVEWDQFVPIDHRLTDQFGLTPGDVLRPKLLCNPVQKDETRIVDPELHYVCYEILVDFDPQEQNLLVTNQYGETKIRTYEPELICLPSTKEHIG